MSNIMKNILFMTIVAAFALLAFRAHAVGSAGCGLGSIVFKGNEWYKQILAVTTNDSTGSQTLGITTGTSNCAPGLFGDAQKQQDYVVANLTSIEREAAQGSGKTLNGLASVLGCDDSQNQVFGIYTQKKYSEIFNSNDANQILLNLKSALQKDTPLSQSCKLINI
ncbi:DUF3015 family protein [Silvanigrella aquatica]|uniref:Orotate phosphoribosyltransferase n=1 Tax=Silvanigrella aquatica TaxID=1915309 RepID=A0A1L4D1D2_9BACT|nr:DUF3015 family protein [Silvanigrella aquatica]APJ04013.1 hypothetical protein AXG55_08875 [Silvanigrella aquatica]